MNIRLVFIFLFCFLLFFNNQTGIAQGNYKRREAWIYYMDKTCRPIIKNLAENSLKQTLNIEFSPKRAENRKDKEVAYFEAFSRTFSGISAWLNCEFGSTNEKLLREEYRKWIIKCFSNIFNPKSKDYLELKNNNQILVEASFLALGIIRCQWIWLNLNEDVRFKIISLLLDTKRYLPYNNNWVLFPAMIESFFYKYNLSYDALKIEYGVNKFLTHHYIGDGLFADKLDFTLDYYNSFVIHPFLNNIIDITKNSTLKFNWLQPKLDSISKLYAEILEKTINLDGSFPVYGRSIVYRGGAFHHLSDMALRHKLPNSTQPSRIRCALFEVIKKTLGNKDNYSKNGILEIGLNGYQPELSDSYISTGSLYICTNIFLPLGLDENDPFWNDPDIKWTSKQYWAE